MMQRWGQSRFLCQAREKRGRQWSCHHKSPPKDFALVSVLALLYILAPSGPSRGHSSAAFASPALPEATPPWYTWLARRAGERVSGQASKAQRRREPGSRKQLFCEGGAWCLQTRMAESTSLRLQTGVTLRCVGGNQRNLAKVEIRQAPVQDAQGA